MGKNISNNIILLLIAILLFSCKSKKNLIAKSANAITLKADFSKIDAKQADFSTFTTKAATALTINDKSFDVTLNIRIKKGEGIWVSVTYIAGLEAARALITPDSLKIMDRINNNYIKKPFAFIHQFSNDDIDYNALEAVLVGNCLPFALNDKTSINQKDGAITLTGQTNQMIYQIGLDQNLKPKSTILVSELHNQKLELNITAFQEILNQLVTKTSTLSSQAGNKKITLVMDYDKTQLNQPVDFPFNVPKRFSVID
ncbi:DUF4292 domain-containing protein [Pedobacter sp. SD-b]|uniref:DUF4292 domain-containing protein n=1 Tax=Pedobacter segetis TaxID=2793069 RepID=A0ABS1BIJ6_9SPHI|nr:DUF4292 domain-containing protein [Pedobacter segetis]MBK0382711.1 DUF4292 domain-containing protein [Pedobacter segetis]